MRRRLGITQAQVAARMGITQGRVSAIEHAQPATTELRTLAAYIEALGGRLGSSAASATSGSPSSNPAPSSLTQVRQGSRLGALPTRSPTAARARPGRGAIPNLKAD
jgi:transcriptional regulator with XRE-family HTH domain